MTHIFTTFWYSSFFCINSCVHLVSFSVTLHCFWWETSNWSHKVFSLSLLFRNLILQGLGGLLCVYAAWGSLGFLDIMVYSFQWVWYIPISSTSRMSSQVVSSRIHPTSAPTRARTVPCSSGHTEAAGGSSLPCISFFEVSSIFLDSLRQECFFHKWSQRFNLRNSRRHKNIHPFP